MDIIWHRARSFAEEAAKRSTELTIGSSKLNDIVLEASKRADKIKTEAIKRADQIKSLTVTVTETETETKVEAQEKDLERFGVTEELREFVNGITLNTFQDFPLQDDSEMSDVPTVSNVRQDLTEWQAKHANFVLSTVKEISKFRYELCPRFMKERKFWRIYFILVNNHVAPYEKQYMEDMKLKSEEAKDDRVKETPNVGTTSKPEVKEPNRQSRTSTSSSAEQDLDIFLLGGDSDDGEDDGGGGFDDDFDDLDKMVDSSDDEKEKS